MIYIYIGCWENGRFSRIGRDELSRSEARLISKPVAGRIPIEFPCRGNRGRLWVAEMELPDCSLHRGSLLHLFQTRSRFNRLARYTRFVRTPLITKQPVKSTADPLLEERGENYLVSGISLGGGVGGIRASREKLRISKLVFQPRVFLFVTKRRCCGR